jgi:hypothetical protein
VDHGCRLDADRHIVRLMMRSLDWNMLPQGDEQRVDFDNGFTCTMTIH